MENNEKLLQYVACSSFIQPSFWNKLSELKINVDKLNENSRNIWGYFTNIHSHWQKLIVEVDSTSFNMSFHDQKKFIPIHGKILNKNTLEQFKDCDKTELINNEGRMFIENLKNDTILEKPSKLNYFFILSFSDLKKYKFYYWFAFPVPRNLPVISNGITEITRKFKKSELDQIIKDYEALEIKQKPYFLLHKTEESIQVLTLHSKLKKLNENDFNEYYFVFADYIFTQQLPRCQLKNYIVLILYYCQFLGGKNLNFIALSLEMKNSQLNCEKSLIFDLTLPSIVEGIEEITWVGWEKNERNQFGPRLANMRSSMDPLKLAEDNVDLNLKLMKWRLLPDINLEKIKSTKCLLLGSGTLGCSVARTLLGWGVRNITFVDNSTVSFSNPVRQSLFTYEDSVNNKAKSLAAAENLKKIFPGVNSHNFQLNIPMPGHSVGETTLQTVRESVESLQELIQNNHVIFLLMDSRESRWLPTLLGSFYEKIVVNVALGFDTYLVMRHGARVIDGVKDLVEAPEGYKAIPGNDLGCYFCNDVTAPGNSLKDRTLDQQCTVTRPGVSMVAGALAVELAVSILQHDEGSNAPAFYKQAFKSEFDFGLDNNQCILGILPHSIRGFLSSFTQVLPATQKYDKCTACSEIVLNEFKERGFEFLCQVFNSSKYLEDLTGLSKLYDEENLIDVVEMSDEEFSDN